MDPEFRVDIIARLTRIETQTLNTNGRVKDHEERVRRLERAAWGLAGAWAMVVTWLKIHIAGGK